VGLFWGGTNLFLRLRLGDKVDTLPLSFVPLFLKYMNVKSGVKVLSKDEEALSEGLDEAFFHEG